MANNPSNQLPETQKAVDHAVPEGNELAVYDAVVRLRILKLAATDGLHPIGLKFRIYGERVMWRLAFEYEGKLTTDDAKKVAWQVTVKGFGAFEPQFYKSDDGKPNHFVAVWFTNGAQEALSHTF